jgi:hypothetical protein
VQRTERRSATENTDDGVDGEPASDAQAVEV